MSHKAQNSIAIANLTSSQADLKIKETKKEIEMIKSNIKKVETQGKNNNQTALIKTETKSNNSLSSTQQQVTSAKKQD